MTYVFTYDGTDAPRWEKSFEAASGEVFAVSLVFENEEDREALTPEQAYEHMENMLQYVKDKTLSLSLIQLNDPPPDGYWPIVNDYEKVEQTMQEIHKWWSWAYYNDAFESDVEEPAEEESA